MKTSVSLEFRIEAMPGSPIEPIELKQEDGTSYWIRKFDRTKEEALKEAFYSEFKLKVAHQWTSIDLDTSKVAAMIDRLRKLKADDLAHIPMARMVLSAVENEQPFEWFLLGRNAEFNNWSCEPFPAAKADQVSMGGHIGDYGHFSEEFRNFYKNSGLRGLEFIWIKDVGRFNARQWFRGIPLKPIGRGVDHPWFDTSKLKGEDSWQPTDPLWRKGVNHFHGDQLRSNAGFSQPRRDAIWDVIPVTNDLTVSTPFMVLREYLPDADFAYTWMSGRTTNVCCNRKAKEFILAQGLARTEQFIPIPVLDEPPPTCENLDKSNVEFPACPLRHCMFETKASIDIVKWRDWSANAYEAHLSNPKPKRVATLKSSLALLKGAKERQGNCFGAPAKNTKFQATEQLLEIAIPDGWRKVLQISNGFQPTTSVPGCDQVLPVEALPSYQKREIEVAKAVNPDFPDHYLFVSHSVTGDSCVLDLSTLTNGECQIVCISHDTQQPDRTWPSIATFLEELLNSVP